MEDILDEKVSKKIIDEIPYIFDFSEIFFYLEKHNIDYQYIAFLNKYISLEEKENIISNWLNLDLSAYQNLKDQGSELKGNTREHVILILSLYKHGTEVFNTTINFEKWLTTRNYLLDNKTPMVFLDTISGIKFIDNRLTAIEFGENV